ncbi:hypothetical protein [Demequina sp.]|uniref:hypothetical protein n=1 Tax=Demequina sp. TaxID=2050685 RepID=UPI003D10FDBF
MAVVIGEIITETAVAPAPEGGAGGPAPAEEQLEAVVRKATERVLETLRREWDR